VAVVDDAGAYLFFALMVTDILSKGSQLLVLGDRRPPSARSASRRPTGRSRSPR
jgi:hypothetical protein